MDELHEPMNAVTPAIDRSFKHTKRVLFENFSIGKWFALGLIIFLESCVESSGGSNYNSSGRSMPSSNDISDSINQAMAWIEANVGLLVSIAIPIAVVFIGLIVLSIWLGCRGQMMFIRALALNNADIGENWREVAEPATSLFKFRLVITGTAYVLGLGFLAFLFYEVVAEARRGTFDVLNVFLTLLPALSFALLVGLALSLVTSVLRNFVAPIMYHKEISCIEAWQDTLPILRQNLGHFALFMLLRIVMQVAGGVVAVVVTLLTCCIGALPILHQTIMAPFYVFERSYSLFVLESLGPEYRIVEAPEAPGVNPNNPFGFPPAGRP